MTDLEKVIAKCEQNAKPDNEIELTDVPELTEEDFSRRHFKYWKPVKKSITVRIDLDNLAWLKEAGKGYQTRLNEVLRWTRQNGCPLVLL